MKRPQSRLSGHDLAKALFHECGGMNIDALVDFVGGETDWLEFKAGLFARPEDLKDGERQEDALWHVARAVFGFLNSSGGLIILGIDDKRKPADLRKSKGGETLADEGMEAYLRKVVEPNLPPSKKKWETGRAGRLAWEGRERTLVKDAIGIEPAKFRGKDIILLFVAPLAKGRMEIVREGDSQVLLVRQPGHVAKVESIKDVQDMVSWTTRRRRVERREFAETLEQFKTEKKEDIRAKGVDAFSKPGKRPAVTKKAKPAPGVLFPCPECGSYVSGNGKNGNQRCTKCGETFHCGVYEENFVPQPDDESSGWAVAKWLLLSFGHRVSDSDLRRQLKVEKTLFNGVTGDDFEDVLDRCKLDVETITLSKKDLNIGASDLCEAFSNDGLVAVEYATDRAPFPETRGATRWIGLERTNKGVVRVMDPWFAFGYLEFRAWKKAAFDDVRAIVKAFSVFEKE